MEWTDPSELTIDKVAAGLSQFTPEAVAASTVREKPGFVPTLIRTRSTDLGQMLDQIHQFEDAIQEQTDWKIVNGPAFPWRDLRRRILLFAGSALRFVKANLPWKPRTVYLSIGYLFPGGLCFKTFPYFDLPARFRILWLYDVWEDQAAKILPSITSYDIRMVFVTSKQGVQSLTEIANGFCECHWLPEAVDVNLYRHKPMSERRIDVIQVGRRWDEYHYRIEQFCRDNALVYRYEKKKCELIFPTRAEFLDAMADTKISICVPSAITHPERSGNVSTMTWRYLESMASKCLVLGRAPMEMKELFDYNPVIEIDMNRPCEQLQALLNDLPRYQELIERNYDYVSRHHQWRNRIATMKNCFADFEQRHPELM